MTVPSTTYRTDYAGTAGTLVFPYTFRTLASNEIVVTAQYTTGEPVVLTNYTVDGVGALGGGNVTFASAPFDDPTLVSLTFTRNPADTQTLDIRNQTAIPRAALEDALDRRTMVSLKQQEEIDRSLKIPVTVTGVSVTLPAPEANKYLAWNAAANAINNMSASTATTVGAGTDLGLGEVVATGSTEAITLADWFAFVVNIKCFGAAVDGVTDDTAAIQAAHDALPSTGGTIFFPRGLCMLGVDGSYVNITKPNVHLVSDYGSLIISPASDNIEVKTGSRYLNGFNITGNNCCIEVNCRGPLCLWSPSASNEDRLFVRNCRFYNLYNGVVAINGTNGFGLLDIDGVTAEYSRDLTSDLGNYHCFSRSANAATAPAKLVRCNRSTFRGVSSAFDIHGCRLLTIGGGTRFEGVDISCIKLATADGLVAEMSLVVDDTVSFDGTAINAGSANRHLACSGTRSTNGTPMYAMFLQIFNNISISARFNNFANECVKFLDGSFVDAVCNFRGARFQDCTNGVSDAQGTVAFTGGELVRSGILWTSAGMLRSLDISRNRIADSVLNITKKTTAAGNFLSVQFNDIAYSVDNNGPIRFTNYGTDTAPILWVDNNVIRVTGGGNTVVANLGTDTKGWFGPNNQYSAAAGTATITGGRFPNTHEPALTGTTSLDLGKIFGGQITIINTNASGAIVYGINDASLVCPVGTKFNVIRTHASRAITFISSGGAINGGTTAAATAQWDSGTFLKVAADTWVLMNQSGTWSIT